MAVTMMTTFKTDAEALAAREAGRDINIVRDYRGHEEGVRHGKACAHYGVRRDGEDKAMTAECVEHGAGAPWGDCCALRKPLYMETTLKGVVLGTGERNGYHDSDFTATYWDGEAPRTMVYASTRGWSYPNNATVDATAEVLEAYEAYLAKREAAAAVARAKAREEEAERKALEPRKGGRAVVFKGRKVAKGTTGVIIWRGEGNWGPRVGIKDDAGEVHWTAESNVRGIVEDKAEGETWVEYTTRKANEAYEAKKTAEAAAPTVGATVKVLRGRDKGTEGTVFWARNGRLGIARKGATKKGRGYADEDVVWTFGDAVEAC